MKVTTITVAFTEELNEWDIEYMMAKIFDAAAGCNTPPVVIVETEELVIPEEMSHEIAE